MDISEEILEFPPILKHFLFFKKKKFKTYSRKIYKIDPN